jgi:hypothetical protein
MRPDGPTANQSELLINGTGVRFPQPVPGFSAGFPQAV